MHTCLGKVKRMYSAVQAANCMYLVSEISHALSSTMAQRRRFLIVVTPHLVTLMPGKPAYGQRFRVDAEHILMPVYFKYHPLTYFCRKIWRLLPAVVILAPGNQVGNILLILGKQMEKHVLAVNALILLRHTQSYYLDIWEHGLWTPARDISILIYKISCKCLGDFSKFS